MLKFFMTRAYYEELIYKQDLLNLLEGTLDLNSIDDFCLEVSSRTNLIKYTIPDLPEHQLIIDKLHEYGVVTICTDEYASFNSL